jgi:3-methyl-2-oxobutanoate hydroxymethyltransferase
MKGTERVAMLTVYDYPTALALDQAGLDILFVGDSLGQVELGLERTSDVTMTMMRHHVSAVARGVTATHLLADLPYGSYDDPEEAMTSARTLLDAGARSVKLEGPRYDIVRHLTSRGIAVMGHVGLLPQTARRYVRQGTKEESADRIHHQATCLVEAGCYAIVLEFMSQSLASRITADVGVPTIGIGAGPSCDGQVLVITDMLGQLQQVPSYVKKYGTFYEETVRAGMAYCADVKAGRFREQRR